MVVRDRRKATKRVCQKIHLLYLQVSMRAVIGQFSWPYSPVRTAKI